MRLESIALASALVAVVAPAHAQVPDTAAVIQELQQEVLSGRLSPEEIRARIRASGLGEAEIRQRLRDLGYPEDLLDQYMAFGYAPGLGTPVTPAQVENIMRQLALPPTAQVPGDSLPVVTDTLPIDSLISTGPPEGLPVFGKSLFRGATTQFRPLTMGPVPANYRLGPGDELVLILTGDVQDIYTLPVTREGFVVIADVGRVSVNGLTLDQLRNSLYTYLGPVYSGVVRGPDATTFFELTISKLRRNQVFVIGEVERPAAYEVTSVATALQALYQSGGPTEQGSFRDIQIRRGASLIASLDIYEYLTQGAARGDVPLDQGDVVFVPVRGRWVEIDGNVVRPGIYELKDGEGLSSLIRLAGGIEPEADLRRIQIDRILPPEQRDPGVQRVLIDVNVAGLLEAEGEVASIEPGDKVYVFAVSEARRNTITISGNVWAPGVYELSQEMSLLELIDQAGGLKDDTYLGRVQIVRLNPLDLSKRMVAVSLAAGDDPLLAEYDVVTVYSVSEFRERRFVTMYGAVQKPGVYDFQDDMTLRDLVIAAGGLRDDAYVLEAEVARVVSQPDASGDFVEIQTVPLDSSYVVAQWASRAGGGQAQAPDFVLAQYDNVFIRNRPDYELQRTVTISGQVRFPGTYALRRKDERLSSLVERAGGLSNEAYAAGIRFFRRTDEQGTDGGPLARVNVDLESILDTPDFQGNLILESGDSIYIPEFIPTVRVEGAVLLPVNVMYEPGADLGYYVNSAGGYSSNGDRGRTRVEYANGSVRTVHKKLLIFKSEPKPQPGSRVFVPEKPQGRGINWVAITAVVTSFATVYALLFK
jgi:protein involved in polysaccharide export with SLBB domain